MSAGAFEDSKYQTDSGDIRAIRVQPETLAANFGGANAAPTGAIDTAGSVRVGGSKRAYGVKARSISIRFTATPPSGYKADQIYRIPILTSALFNSINNKDTGTYLGVAARVVGKSAENVR